MKWLISGGCGFIGRAFIRNLLGEGGHRVRVYDNLSVGRRADLAELDEVADLDETFIESDWSDRLALLKGDILDKDLFERATDGADVLVHLAANTGVFPSVQDPMLDCRTNVLGTLHALEACRAKGVRRMVFASSGAPLGVQTPPLHEKLAPHPASPYGASKLAGEGYCSAYFHCFGVETVVLRFGNVYGEGSTLKGSVVAKFIKQAMAGERLEIYGDGNQTRDFLHISDLVRAVRLAATTADIGGETFQIATASETTVWELTEQLLSALAEAGIGDVDVFHGEQRPGDVMRNFSDTRKAKAMMGWKAETALPEGLRRTVRFFCQIHQN